MNLFVLLSFAAILRLLGRFPTALWYYWLPRQRISPVHGPRRQGQLEQRTETQPGVIIFFFTHLNKI